MRPPDEVKKELALQWLKKADEDLRAAEVLMASGLAFSFAVGFHAQQASEKYLKAFLTWKQIEFFKTHDLGQLLDLILTVDKRIPEALRDLTLLTIYGVEVRYPGDYPPLSDSDAQKAVALALQARDLIAKAII